MENFFTRFFTFFGRFHNPFPKSSTHFSLFVAFSVNIASPKCGGWKGKRSFGLLSVERVRNWKAGSNHKGFISFLLPYLLRGIVFFFSCRYSCAAFPRSFGFCQPVTRQKRTLAQISNKRERPVWSNPQTSTPTKSETWWQPVLRNKHHRIFIKQPEFNLPTSRRLLKGGRPQNNREQFSHSALLQH